MNWLEMVRTSSIVQHIDRAETDALYDSMLLPVDEDRGESDPLTPRVIEQIQIDLERTTTADGVLIPLSPLATQSRLEHVLYATVKLHPGLGYVQGMNEVAAKMLGCLEQDGVPPDELEHTCFFLLRVLFSLVPDYWSANLVGTQVDASILNELLPQHCPGMFHQICSDFGMDIGVLVLPWLIALFAQSFPAAFLKPAWEYLFEVGRPALVHLSLAVLEWLGPAVEKCSTDFSKIVQTCQDSTRQMSAATAIDIVNTARTTIALLLESKPGGFAQLSGEHLARVRQSQVEREMRQVNWLRTSEEIILTDEEVETIKRDFINVRDTIDGVSMGQFQQVICKHKGDAFATLSTELLFRVWDSDGNGVLGLAELMLGLSAFAHGLHTDRMRLAFNAFDKVFHSLS